MTVYVIVQLKMTDRAAYDRYQARFFDVFKKFSGRLLSADEKPTIVEGAWDRDKLVLMSFPDEAAFHAWADSPEYLEISKDRKAGAQGIVLLAKGFAALEHDPEKWAPVFPRDKREAFARRSCSNKRSAFTTTAQIQSRGKTAPAFDTDTADSHKVGRSNKAGRSRGTHSA
jgi:uncharacterized protein (DUF1330 family)